MLLLERNALVTVSPRYDRLPEGVKRYRWSMHLSLPFPFPSRKCISKDVALEGESYAFEIHNHFDRAIVSRGTPGMPQIHLCQKNMPIDNLPADAKIGIEKLQSVAKYTELREYEDPNAAFADAAGKIKKCLNHLADYLAACQQCAPYLTSWLVYPISTFDSGTVYHEVQRFCIHHDRWILYASNVAIALARNLRHPLFFLENLDPEIVDSPFTVTDQMLAEGLMSLFRGMPRLTVLNSYGAVELLANITFTEKHSEKLKSEGVPEDRAREFSELLRKGNNRTDPTFLFHKGLKQACGRSLCDEDKEKYDRILAFQKLRHDVAHVGRKPSDEEARECHKLCCEVAQWLNIVSGRVAKPLLPKDEDVIKGLSVESSDPFAVGSPQMDTIRRLLDVTSVDFGRIPQDLATFVRTKVEDGTYANETEVVLYAVRRLKAAQ